MGIRPHEGKGNLFHPLSVKANKSGVAVNPLDCRDERGQCCLMKLPELAKLFARMIVRHRV